jgi:hypothetical protein
LVDESVEVSSFLPDTPFLLNVVKRNGGEGVGNERRKAALCQQGEENDEEGAQTHLFVAVEVLIADQVKGGRQYRSLKSPESEETYLDETDNASVLEAFDGEGGSDAGEKGVGRPVLPAGCKGEERK